MNDWHPAIEPPQDAGYYLVAWGGIVSEAWFNPPTGWWSNRGYFGQNNGKQLSVVAWQPKPEYPDERERLLARLSVYERLKTAAVAWGRHRTGRLPKIGEERDAWFVRLEELNLELEEAAIFALAAQEPSETETAARPEIGTLSRSSAEIVAQATSVPVVQEVLPELTAEEERDGHTIWWFDDIVRARTTSLDKVNDSDE